jgi:hypothetical protein
MLHYRKTTDGEWVRPVMRNWRVRCCDCGLIHRITFKIIRWGRGRKIIFRATRDDRATKRFRSKTATVKITKILDAAKLLPRYEAPSNAPKGVPHAV